MLHQGITLVFKFKRKERYIIRKQPEKDFVAFPDRQFFNFFDRNPIQYSFFIKFGMESRKPAVIIAMLVCGAVFLAYDTAAPSLEPSGSRSRHDGMLLRSTQTKTQRTATKQASARNEILSENASAAHVITGEAIKVDTPVEAMHTPSARPL